MSKILSGDASYLAHKYSASFKSGIRILITGASGLIGVNLLAFFLSEEFSEKSLELHILVNSDASRVFLEGVFPNANFNFIKINLLSLESQNIYEYFDYIFHLATYGQPGKFLSEKQETMRLNSIGLVRLFDYLGPGGRFFNASTSEVYSGNLNLPHIESEIGTTTTVHARASYIEAKRFGEAYCYLKAESGVKAYSGRISLAFGPGFRKGDRRVLNEFIFSGLQSGVINMMDDGSALRVYCYIRDALDMVLALIHTDHFEPINISGVEKVSIIELAYKVGKICKAEVIPGSPAKNRSGAPLVVSSSTELSARILNKKSYVSIDEGVERSTEWGRYLLGLTSA
jgi:nucleoside-diphosphate-sugar epimerase